jgi:hypothetical protein
MSAPLVPVGLVFLGEVAGEARQAPPQSRPRYFCAHSETDVRPCCPHLNPLGRERPESFARLALTRVPLVAALGLELGILGEKPHALEGAGTIRMPISIGHPPRQLQPKRRDQLRCGTTSFWPRYLRCRGRGGRWKPPAFW